MESDESALSLRAQYNFLRRGIIGMSDRCRIRNSAQRKTRIEGAHYLLRQGHKLMQPQEVLWLAQVLGDDLMLKKTQNKVGSSEAWNLMCENGLHSRPFSAFYA